METAVDVEQPPVGEEHAVTAPGEMRDGSLRDVCQRAHDPTRGQRRSGAGGADGELRFQAEEAPLHRLFPARLPHLFQESLAVAEADVFEYRVGGSVDPVQLIARRRQSLSGRSRIRTFRAG